ncbi:RING and UBP finger domain-containing protein [Trichophyton tonsurans CBS 112818]|uniref:RING and UBP finger domain-containing protein n=1 Tax=Trichophyton tonsurans (strain CBS 112818) TaxID=647933 RepID=F2S349_TRIT1|nr:RING and UBP finger domain-containing protein [Trichophyton tonsurans CBS 112818]
MPSYFYHLILEVLSHPQASASHTPSKDAQKHPSTETSLEEYALTLKSLRESVRPFRRKKAKPAPNVATDLANHLATTSLQDTEIHTDRDPRTDNLSIQGVDMVHNEISKGIGSNVISGLATKGKYVPLDLGLTDSVYGIVHLYRDAEETPSLSQDNHDQDLFYLQGVGSSSHPSASGPGHVSGPRTANGPAEETLSLDDCTTLCILAVPSYLSPSDFLGYVGEQTMEDVSHFRMVKTARANRYMVLMKFRSGKKAKEWQDSWNGKLFNSMEPEACHVVFVKDVEIQVSSSAAESKFPDMKNDPFPFSDAPSTMSSKPLAPPTPSLIELPTCPVCLERMDETSGLLTILCQHVFHCTCLQRWKGSGCPVCRYTQDDLGKRNVNFAMDEGPSECSVCHSEVNLWICLICGNIGCGRYDGAHAFDHYKETSHSFAMDLTSQRVWDYLGDGYVHRIIQGKSDGKLLELPARGDSALDPPDWSDAVPREKFENISVEYTHLLTSQLESQRVYFEEQVERAADKASKASASAISAQEAAERLARDMEKLQSQYDSLTQETIPSLERDKARAERRAEKFESMSRTMEKQWREEKTMNASLMERVEFLDAEVTKLKAANEDLAEQNRDLTFFISGTERLKNQGEDVVEGTVSVPDPPTSSSKRKGKRKAKK